MRHGSAKGPEPQRFVCPYCLPHEPQDINCFKGQLECMVCGMAVCYAASQPWPGGQAVPGITPAQKVLGDAASSYAGDRAEEQDIQEKGPPQDLSVWIRATHRHQMVWDKDTAQRLIWSGQGRSRECRWPKHFQPWVAEHATSRPPPGSEIVDAIQRTNQIFRDKLDAVRREQDEKGRARQDPAVPEVGAVLAKAKPAGDGIVSPRPALVASWPS